MSTSNSNPQVGVTNNTSDTLVIYDVFNPSKNGQQVPYQYTKLATLAPKETKSVQTIREASQLQAMYTGKIEEMNNAYYYQFPIKVMSAVQFTFDNPPPLKYTIEKGDKAAMIQSFFFHRFAMANPDSALTKNLYAALKKGNVKAVNNFFESTKNFKNCTLGTWNAILSWMQMFSSPWQGPYYIYKQAPNPVPENYIPQLIATLSIKSDAQNNTATLTMCSADSKGNPVFTNPPETTEIIMNGDGTMGDSSPGQDVSVSLTPIWMNVVQTKMVNKTPVSNYYIGPAVTGTVAGNKVVSSQTARQLPGKPADPKKASSFDAIFGKLGQTVGLIVGLLFLGEFAMKMWKGAKEKITELKEKATSKKEFEEESESVENTSDPELVSDIESEEDTFNNDGKEVSGNYNEISDALQKDVMEQTMEDTAKNIQEEISNQLDDGYTPTEEFESAVNDMNESFKEAKQDIEDGDFSEANSKLSDASKNINETIEKTGEELADWEKSTLEESSDAVKDAADESDALDKAQEERDQDIENGEDDSGYDADDEEWPEAEDIPFEL